MRILWDHSLIEIILRILLKVSNLSLVQVEGYPVDWNRASTMPCLDLNAA